MLLWRPILRSRYRNGKMYDKMPLGLLGRLKVLLPCLKKIWADGAYTGEKLAG
jgi:hypothetical protein